MNLSISVAILRAHVHIFIFRTCDLLDPLHDHGGVRVPCDGVNYQTLPPSRSNKLYV